MIFEPLRIEIRLSTPVALPYSKQPHPLHFDALLIALMAEGKVFQPDQNIYAPGTGEVPLQVHPGKSPVYCASVGFSDQIHTDYYAITKKPPDFCEWEHIISTSHKKIEFAPGGAGSGKFRAWKEESKLAISKTIVFECIGDGEMIDTILHQKLRRIGFLRRAGMGNVCDIIVSESENPNAGLLTSDNRPARNLPVVDWEGNPDWLKIHAAVRAPYWYPGNKELCWSPVSEKTIPGH